jgi:hypothetical protein
MMHKAICIFIISLRILHGDWRPFIWTLETIGKLIFSDSIVMLSWFSENQTSCQSVAVKSGATRPGEDGSALPFVTPLLVGNSLQSLLCKEVCCHAKATNVPNLGSWAWFLLQTSITLVVLVTDSPFCHKFLTDYQFGMWPTWFWHFTYGNKHILSLTAGWWLFSTLSFHVRIIMETPWLI